MALFIKRDGESTELVEIDFGLHVQQVLRAKREAEKKRQNHQWPRAKRAAKERSLVHKLPRAKRDAKKKSLVLNCLERSEGL